MKIKEVIQKMKDYHYGLDKSGNPIDETKTRDKVLFGNVENECTGIVTTCFASVDVIRKAIELNCNLIICHEALFWNHGDHTDWLKDNKVFQKKKELLETNNIVVWRDHDYIHSGILKDGKIVDGIFYGVASKLGWLDYRVGDKERSTEFMFEEAIEGKELVDLCLDKFNLNGVRLVGDINTKVKKLFIAPHLIGGIDNDCLKKVEEEDIDCLISMEITDFTMSEYIRDSAMLERPRLIIEIGHFNTEEPGMEYMLEYIIEALGINLPVHFIKSSDSFTYYIKEEK